MTPDDFAHKYQSKIRVIFDWDRFRRERWPISQRHFTMPQEFSESFAPWYLNSQAVEVSFDSPGATPVRFGDMPGALARLSPLHRLGILTYVELTRNQTDDSEISVPAYAVGNGRFIALDANHRLAALVLVGRPCNVVADVVAGPLEASCLADILVHRCSTPSAPGRTA